MADNASNGRFAVTSEPVNCSDGNQPRHGKIIGVPERHDPDQVAADLSNCRQRGLDWLDRKTSNQSPVRADELERLARDYAAARHPAASGRIAQIKILLIDGINDLRRQGRGSDADLLRDLFFGESTEGVIKPPGELLRNAQRRAGDTTDTRFRERRANATKSFAHTLIMLAAPAAHGNGPVPYEAHQTGDQFAVTGYAADSEHFVDLLANAVNVTIVGITNERLLPMLQEALRRKREKGRSDAFWGSLRIVFLSKDLLGTVSDERERFHDSSEALRQRRQEAIWARRLVAVFLKRTRSPRWALFECRYQPMLTGAHFEFADDRKNVVHLLIRRPRHPAADSLYIDLEDPTDQFGPVFEDIVHTSESDNMIVPVGAPAGREAFQCNEVRVQSDVLKDGSNVGGWLPMVLVITRRRRRGRVEPIVQLRTIENSAREENRLSHLGGHILQEDRLRPGGHQLDGAVKSFDLQHEIPASAAARLVREMTGADPASVLQPMAAGGYLYPDKENLFFFVFALDLPDGLEFPRRAEMHSLGLPDLMAVRAGQVLRSAADLCRASEVSESAWKAAAEVVALNLSLHDHSDLADKLVDLAGRSVNERTETATVISEYVVGRTISSWASASREVSLMGLAGWQYREFFSVLLPLYAQIGIHEAAELLDAVNADGRKSAARDRLADLYQDEHLIALLPMEL